MNKVCSKCGGEFPATTEYWHRNKGTKDGLHTWCKPCERARSWEAKQRLTIDPTTGETLKASTLSKRRLVTDPVTKEVITVGALSSRRLVIDPRTGHACAASALSQRKRYQSGKYQEYLDNNTLVKLQKAMANLIRASMKARGWSKTTKTQALVGCSFEFLMNHLQASLPDYEKHEVIHIDHMLPCSSAENEDELNALQHYSNLQWLPGSENISKGASLPPDWQERKAQLMALYWSRFPERRKAA